MNSIIYKLNSNHKEQLTELYQKEWWTKGRSLEQTTMLISNSSIVIGVVDQNDQLVAFARILTDRVIKAIIFDVIVKDDQRGEGLGERLMNLIFNHEDLRTVREFELYCQDEMTPFYKKFDFRSLNEEMFYMRKINIKSI